MNREFRRAGNTAWLLLGWCVACNGGRSDIDDDLGDTGNESQASGGVANGTGRGGNGNGGVTKSSPTSNPYQRGGTTGVGGATGKGGSNANTKGGATAKGGSSAKGGSGGKGGATSGGSSAGGAGGRTVGGTSSYGGVSGMAMGGSTLRGGAGGVSGVGGIARAGAPPSNGGITSLGGASGSGGAITTSVAGRTGTGGSPIVAGAGGTTGVAGWSGSAGVAGSAGAAGCSPAPRTTTPGAAGAGGGTAEEWYVDAVNGSDIAPGTQSQPLKTLSCASSVAKTGDTVSLKDGTWDGTNEPSLSSVSILPCGSGAGIAFAPDVRVRAVNPGAARISSSANHGLCMSGGSLEGVRMACYDSYPVVETSQGALTLTGTSLAACNDIGLVVNGTAAVTLRPGNLTDYVESGVVTFAKVGDQARLTVEGGKFSILGEGIQATDNATVVVHGAAFAGPSVGSARYGMQLTGNANLTVDGGSTTEFVAVGVYGNAFRGQINIDGLTCSNGTLGVDAYNTLGLGAAAEVKIKNLHLNSISSVGVDVDGDVNVSIANLTVVHTGSPSIVLNGSGTATIKDTTITDSYMGVSLYSDPSGSGRSLTARNLTVTGSQGPGLVIYSDIAASYDLGTVADPGNNVFRDNRATFGNSNLEFSVPSYVTIYAIGNTWNANAQGADANGKYVAPSGFALETTTGTGLNFTASQGSTGKLRLAESP